MFSLDLHDNVAYISEAFIITFTFDAGFGFIDLHFKVINYFVTLPNARLFKIDLCVLQMIFLS